MNQHKGERDVPRRCKPNLAGLTAGCGDDGMRFYLACVGQKVGAGGAVHE
jgi:hypothetical protein